MFESIITGQQYNCSGEMGELMSCCSTNIFKELYQRYGQEFAKLMVAEKGKRLIAQEFTSLTGKFDGVFGEFEGKTNSAVEKGHNEIQTTYQQLKAKVNSTIPGGITALQKLKGESIDEFSGYNKLQGKVQEIKKQALSKIDGQKVKLKSEMGEKKTEMVNKVQENRPKIPIYEQLPDTVKTVLLTEAETKFAEQIKNNKSQIVDQIAKSFNLENVQALYSKISPQGPLQNIVGNALKMLSSSVGSGGFGSSVNNLISNGLSFLK